MSQKILIVEDDRVSARLLLRQLESLGFEVETAEDGVSAMYVACSTDISMVLTDIQIPRFSGPEVIAALRRFDVMVPAVAMSASNYPGGDAQLHKDGFQHFIKKPFSKSQLREVVAVFCGAESSMPGMPKIRLEGKNKGAKGAEKLIERYFDSLPSRMWRLYKAYADGDREELLLLSHRLKGSGAFGLGDIHKVAGDIEDCLRSEAGFERLAEVLAELSAEVDRTLLHREALAAQFIKEVF